MTAVSVVGIDLGKSSWTASVIGRWVVNSTFLQRSVADLASVRGLRGAAT
jgi:hypothetical protein